MKPGHQAQPSGCLWGGTQKCCLRGGWEKLGALSMYWGLGTWAPSAQHAPAREAQEEVGLSVKLGSSSSRGPAGTGQLGTLQTQLRCPPRSSRTAGFLRTALGRVSTLRSCQPGLGAQEAETPEGETTRRY